MLLNKFAISGTVNVSLNAQWISVNKNVYDKVDYLLIIAIIKLLIVE